MDSKTREKVAALLTEAIDGDLYTPDYETGHDRYDVEAALRKVIEAVAVASGLELHEVQTRYRSRFEYVVSQRTENDEHD